MTEKEKLIAEMATRFLVAHITDSGRYDISWAHRYVGYAKVILESSVKWEA
jgi:hypothetical protein